MLNQTKQKTKNKLNSNLNFYIMKKTNFFKIVLTLVMAFAFSGAFAQFVAQDSDAAEAIDSVTVGVNVPYYVEPDIYFNPGWAGTATDPDVAGLVNSTFVWAAPSPAGAGGAATATDVAVGDNYIEYSFPDVDTYTLSVQETANSCPGTAVTMDVEVINEPTNAWNAAAGYINADITECETSLALDDQVGVTFTTDVNDSYSIQLDWELEIKTLTSGGADDKFWDDVNLSTAPVSGVPVAIDNTATAGNQVTSIDVLTYDLTKPADGFVAIDDAGKKTTVYTYTVNGVNDRISRKSDYITNSGGAATGWSWYGTAESIVITVNPAPVTGPIYHISNIWAD